MSTTPSNPSPAFSPSRYHKALMKRTRPALAFDGGEVGPWQGRLRRKLRQLLGMPAANAPRPPLRVRSLWTRNHELGVIEKIIFTAAANVEVPAYVCTPHEFAEPHTWFVGLQGHSTGMHLSIGGSLADDTKPGPVEGDRDFGLTAMAHGVGMICIEQRCFGERQERELPHRFPQTCHDASMHALMLGETMVGQRVWDLDRAIDYLMTRDDVDPDRIGVMGNSGGGTISLFGAAMLKRIAFAMPSCYFCTFADSLMSIGHCCCNYVPHLLRYAEMWDVGGLIAPRPIVIVSGRDDELFPIEATKKAFAKLKRIYAAAGAASKCRHVIGQAGHQFYAADAWPVMKKLMG